MQIRAYQVQGRNGGLTSVRPEIEFDASSGALRLHSGVGQACDAFTLGTAGTLRFTGGVSDSYNFTQLDDGTQLDTAQMTRALSRPGTDGVQLSTTLYATRTGSAADQTLLLKTAAGGHDYVLTAHYGKPGIKVYEKQAGLSLSHRFDLADTQNSYLADPVSMASVERASGTIVLATSSSEAGLSSYRLNDNGSLSLIESLGAQNGIGIHVPTALAVTESGGKTLVLLGAAGTSNISVFELSSDGHLTHLRNCMDDLSTRFQSLSVLQTARLGDTTYVVAGGNDDGLSLFTLLPNGQLVHQNTLVDTNDIGLANVHGLELAVLGNALHGFATSEYETGVAHVVWTPDSGYRQRIGTDASERLNSAGSALLFDGAGADTLVASSGDDRFVLASDGARDIILDFTPGKDIADISGWSRLYSTLQLGIISKSWGAEIRYNDEILEIHTASNSALTYEDFVATDMLNVARLARPSSYQVPDHYTNPNTSSGGVQDAGTTGGTTYGNTGSGSSPTPTPTPAPTPTPTPAPAPTPSPAPPSAINFYGTYVSERIWGGSRNDKLYGAGGNDSLHGAGGNDTISGGDSHDQLYGDAGDDYISGGTGADHIRGGDGNDTIEGDSSTDTLEGGGGNDLMRGGTGADTLYGGSGDDKIFGNTGVDEIHGGAGNDWISPGNGVDIVFGDRGNDKIIGRTGWDTLHGGSGNDSIYGSEGRDKLFGDSGADFLSGGSGIDTLKGGAGNDTLYGNLGADWLEGGSEDDQLFGATGDDTLIGGEGNDTLYSSQGNDRLIGGPGDDMLYGGTLKDTFYFAPGHGSDHIPDYETQDIIELSRKLVGYARDGAAVVNSFGRVHKGDVVLDFGASEITIDDISDLSAIAHSIVLV